MSTPPTPTPSLSALSAESAERTPSGSALAAESAGRGAGVEATAQRAAAIAPVLAATPPAALAAGLRAAATALRADADRLIVIAAEETGLAPTPRLRGELERTAVQLELFSEVALDGSHLDLRIDEADPAFRPLPRPDLRRMLVPLGPVLVFAASNFPFAFSVAGGDTAAALAAGCPVVVKAHPGHPQLSAAVADVVRAALDGAGLPADSLQLAGLPGAEGPDDDGVAAGVALLRDERIAAASFTGSQRAGRYLADVAAARRRPIPFYGELGSTNPVVVTEGALAAARAAGVDTFAAAYATSATASAGQLCTQPGFVFLPDGALDADGGSLADALAHAFSAVSEHRLLHPGIAAGYSARRDAVLGSEGVVAVVEGRVRSDEAGQAWATPTLVRTTLEALLAGGHGLREEAFGPLSVMVEYPSLEALTTAVPQLYEGELTAAVHVTTDEAGSAEVAALVAELSAVAGRVLFNGWPTGVSVTPAMQHGGPYPATTDAGRTTSVGTAAIGRFLRPVAFQDAPAALLPPALRDEEPWGVPRTVSRAGESASWGVSPQLGGHGGSR
ncbi:NADP-dependent aldehyde dehydrogenase [Quadrisphaera granulorum]|uniref:NADP-dependent aldehyde dehydrogenase n=1 Tax=Quadrisphaera granulorum TaxID=317664 RepID=A0A315ZXC9_9ACTN|nr:aldehyde dehydrogenase family protein [Quadrisphaera granulorum]PWJ49550.1 NADP-dependent aldehyde dehydrogenase [Quadrisphaera granulorum]SZE98129.1 NADP-dependent aldehyde dehydrogenase [Quadrisphaera granulorum]